MKKFNNICGLIEIVGGCIGIIIILSKYLGSLVGLSDENTNLSLIFILISTSLYIISIMAGYLLLKHKKSGLILSIFNQIIQLFEFILGSFKYLFVSGLSLSFGMLDNKLIYTYHIGSSFNLTILNNSHHFYLKVNILAFALLIYFAWQLKNKLYY